MYRTWRVSLTDWLLAVAVREPPGVSAGQLGQHFVEQEGAMFTPHALPAWLKLTPAPNGISASLAGTPTSAGQEDIAILVSVIYPHGVWSTLRVCTLDFHRCSVCDVCFCVCVQTAARWVSAMRRVPGQRSTMATFRVQTGSKRLRGTTSASLSVQRPEWSGHTCDSCRLLLFSLRHVPPYWICASVSW
jgi:hypothetical protein